MSTQIGPDVPRGCEQVRKAMTKYGGVLAEPGWPSLHQAVLPADQRSHAAVMEDNDEEWWTGMQIPQEVLVQTCPVGGPTRRRFLEMICIIAAVGNSSDHTRWAVRAVSSQTTWENQARVHAEVVKISQSEQVRWQPVVHLRSRAGHCTVVVRSEQRRQCRLPEQMEA